MTHYGFIGVLFLPFTNTEEVCPYGEGRRRSEF